MQLRFILIIMVSFSGLNNVKSQNVLDGVYVRDFILRNGDTLETVVSGKVLSKDSLRPLPNILVEYFASNGQTLSTRTDINGNFRFAGLAADNIKAKVVCCSPKHLRKTWEFNTYEISQPRNFEINFELVSNVRKD